MARAAADERGRWHSDHSEANPTRRDQEQAESGGGGVLGLLNRGFSATVGFLRSMCDAHK